MSLSRAVRAALGVALAACSPGPRDVAAEGRAVRAAPEEEPRTGAVDAYVHVARRPHGVVALAEVRHAREADARAFVERLADELEACASGLEARAELVEGAARVVAVAGARGVAEGMNVRLAPGAAVAQNALLCVLAPVRALPMPASSDGSAPGLAIEVTWQPAPGGRALPGKLQPGALDAGASPPPP